jgi:hypothetical protein
MSLTSSLDALCLAEVSEGCRLRGVSTLVLLVLCATALTTAALSYADLSAPNIVYFLDLPSKAICVLSNIPRSVCASRLEAVMCVNGAPFRGTRVPGGAAVHSVKSRRCLEPFGSNKMEGVLCAFSKLKAERCPQRSYLFWWRSARLCSTS